MRSGGIMKKKAKENVLVDNNIDRLLRENRCLRQQRDNAEARYLSFKVASVKHYNEAADAAFSYKNALRFVVNEKLELKSRLEESDKQFDELVVNTLIVAQWFKLILRGVSNFQNCSVISLYHIKIMVNNMVNLLLQYQKQQPAKIFFKNAVKVEAVE